MGRISRCQQVLEYVDVLATVAALVLRGVLHLKQLDKMVAARTEALRSARDQLGATLNALPDLLR